MLLGHIHRISHYICYIIFFLFFFVLIICISCILFAIFFVSDQNYATRHQILKGWIFFLIHHFILNIFHILHILHNTTYYAYSVQDKSFGGVKGLSFISNCQRRKEGTFSVSELARIEPTPARSGRAGYAHLNLSATGGMPMFLFGGVSSFISINAWFPIPWPSCSHTITYIHHGGFLAKRAWKVCWFSSRLEGYRNSRANYQRNKRHLLQYGGHWNDIQDLFWFTAIVYDGLARIQPNCATTKQISQNM